MIFFAGKRYAFRVSAALLAFIFSASVLSPSSVTAGDFPSSAVHPGQMFVPVLLKGLTIHPEDPLQFDFIVDSGNTDFSSGDVRQESQRLIKYFMTALTVPKDDLWVNLSPQEPDRIIPSALGKTDLGRDMLAQDYVLKQITSSLMDPGSESGKRFWDKIYSLVQGKLHTSEIPLNILNKVWIVPESAAVYENGHSVYITQSRLKVMLERDYLASKNGALENSFDLSLQIVRDIILPQIEREVNEGKDFAPLRQIYHSLILAKWYKDTLRGSILSNIYFDQNKISGIESDDPAAKDRIYNQYVETFKKGTFNVIKEDYDSLSQQVIPRQYFSGGQELGIISLQRVQNTGGLASSAVGANYTLTMRMEPEKDKAMLDDYQQDALKVSDDSKEKNPYIADDNSGIDELIRSSVPGEFWHHYDVVHNGAQYYKEKNTLRHHLQWMLDAINSVDDVPEILPLYYRNFIKNNREFFEKVVLFHDIGKNNVHYVMEDGSISFVGHEDESVRMLDEYQDLLKGYPQRDLVKKISGLHGTPFNLTGVKDEIREDFEGFLKKNEINLHEFELLVCTIFLDMYWPHPANKNYDQEMGRIKEGIRFIEGIKNKKVILNIEYLDAGLKGEEDRVTATMVNLKDKRLVFKGWDKRSADPFTAEEQQVFRDGGPQVETSFALTGDQIKSYRHKFHERQSGEVTVEAVITDNEDKKHYYYLTGADTTALDNIKNVRPTLEELRHPDAEFEVSAANQGDLVGNFTILPNVSRDGWKLYAAVNEPWNNKSHRSLIQKKNGEIKIGFVRLQGESDKNRIHQIYFRQGLKNDDSIGEYLLSPEEVDFIFIAYVLGWEGTEVRELLKENYVNTSDLRHVFRLPFIDIEGGKGNLFYKQIAQNSEIFGDVFAGKAVDLELTYNGRNLLDPEFGFLELMESNGYLQKFDPQDVNDPGDYYIDGDRISIIFLPARYPVNVLAVSEDGLNMAFVIVEGFSGRLGRTIGHFMIGPKNRYKPGLIGRRKPFLFWIMVLIRKFYKEKQEMNKWSLSRLPKVL